jgi:hypothetical protein
MMCDNRQSDLGGGDLRPFRPGWLLAGLLLFGMGFAFVEAVVAVDLRTILGPIAGRAGSPSADEVFPLPRSDWLERADPAAARLMRIEVWREGATLVLLAGVGLAAGRTFLQRFAAFLVAFGVWDLGYYASLNLLLGWPASVWTWDVLFLIPVPWAAPVLAPASVAASMVAAGTVVLAWEASGRRFRVSAWDWLAIVLGGLLLIAAFCWDWRNLRDGGLPNPFTWPLFVVGEAVGLGGFLRAGWTSWDRATPGRRASAPGDPIGAAVQVERI